MRPSAQQPAWSLCWATDAADHDCNPLTAIMHLPMVPGLPKGDAHAGWMLTASENLIQLWECSSGKGPGIPALMMVHSRGVDGSTVGSMTAELATRMIITTAVDTNGAEWVGTHSLDPETVLAQRGKLPMPHRTAARQAGRNCHAAVSLHSYGGPLAEHCAASYGGGIVVWEVGSAVRPAAPAAPLALWRAHDYLITSLHAGRFGLHLFSGAADGRIHVWNMKTKPSAPVTVLKQRRRVVGMHQTDDRTLVAASLDGSVAVWDLRNTVRPRNVVIPDGTRVDHMAASHLGDAVAVSTAKGLFCIDVLDPLCPAVAIAPQGLPCPVTALAWNSATSEVAAGGADGCVRVYRQRKRAG